MKNNRYEVEGRLFRNLADYNLALKDKKLIDTLRNKTKGYSVEKLTELVTKLKSGKTPFSTILGQDYIEELEERIRTAKMPAGMNKSGISYKDDARLNEIAVAELRKQDKRRRLMILICSLLGVACLGYFGIYSYRDYKVKSSNAQLSQLKDKPVKDSSNNTPESMQSSVVVNLDAPPEAKEVLDEYKNLIIKNKKLIGWLKIDDTNIDYPVMQTSDNEYYQNHNLNQEYDKNGSIFMDKDCDVIKPSTNYILYGHHMKSGRMFGTLDHYESEKFYKEHKYIQFDTIYEKGLYQVMYVFRSRVYNEDDIVFKYYQFIDAYSEQEFDSYMQEMAAMSFYDTGVTAVYGDQLLTLSTCDYQEKDGRFVVVAKRVEAKE